MCFVWVFFPSLCVCLVDPFNQFWGIFLKYFFDFTPPPSPLNLLLSHIVPPRLVLQFSFLSFPSLCIFFFTMEGCLQLLSPNLYAVLLIFVI